MLDTEDKYGGNRQTKSYPKRKLLPKFDDEAIAPIPLKTIRPTGWTDHLMVETEQPTMPYTSLHPLPKKEGRARPRTRNTIYVRTWTKKLAKPGPSMDPGNVLLYGITIIKPNTLVTY